MDVPGGRRAPGAPARGRAGPGAAAGAGQGPRGSSGGARERRAGCSASWSASTHGRGNERRRGLRAERRPGIVEGAGGAPRGGTGGLRGVGGARALQGRAGRPCARRRRRWGRGYPRAAAVLGEPEDRLAERADALRREREAGKPEGGRAGAPGPRRRARALRGGQRAGVGRRSLGRGAGDGADGAWEGSRGGARARQPPGEGARERLRTRIELAAVQFKESEGALRDAIQARGGGAGRGAPPPSGPAEGGAARGGAAGTGAGGGRRAGRPRKGRSAGWWRSWGRSARVWESCGRR